MKTLLDFKLLKKGGVIYFAKNKYELFNVSTYLFKSLLGRGIKKSKVTGLFYLAITGNKALTSLIDYLQESKGIYNHEIAIPMSMKENKNIRKVIKTNYTRSR